MKIAIVRRDVGFSMGGAEGYAANCAMQLKRLGHKVTIVANRSSVRGIDFIRAPIYGRGSFLKNLSFFISVRRILNTRVFDVVYSCSRTAPSHLIRISDPLHAMWLKKRYGSRLNKIIKYLPRNLLLLWLEKMSIESASIGVVTNSRLTEQHVSDFYRIPKNKIYVLYNGVDFSRFNLNVRKYRQEVRSRLGINSTRDKLLIFVGSDWKRKGLDTLMEAVKMLPKNVYLIVVGGKRLASSGKVSFLGPVRNVEKLYGASDLLVLPTKYDPFSNVVLEALACGIPAVTSRCNGAAEVIKEGKTGFIVNTNSWELADAITKMLEISPGPEECYESVKEFTWHNHVTRLFSVFGETINKTDKRKGMRNDSFGKY